MKSYQALEKNYANRTPLTHFINRHVPLWEGEMDENKMLLAAAQPLDLSDKIRECK